MTSQRAVCLNCMDGRAQLPVIEWITNNHGADCVDMITEPGMDGLLADGNNSIEAIIQKIQISIEKNDAAMIFVAGHHDCKGNPVDESSHKDHIQKGVERIRQKFTNIDITGLWVNEAWQCERL